MSTHLLYNKYLDQHFKTGVLLQRLFCQNKYATKYITPCTYYIIYGRKLYNMIHVWVIYQFFFESPCDKLVITLTRDAYEKFNSRALRALEVIFPVIIT